MYIYVLEQVRRDFLPCHLIQYMLVLFPLRVKHCLKKNLNAFRPSEHPTQGEKCQNAYLVGRIIGCKDKTSSWHLNGFLDGSNIGSTVLYNVGEKPIVILYTYYINRHAAGTPKKL